MITNPWFCGVGKLRSQGSSNALALRCHGRSFLFVEGLHPEKQVSGSLCPPGTEGSTAQHAVCLWVCRPITRIRLLSYCFLPHNACLFGEADWQLPGAQKFFFTLCILHQQHFIDLRPNGVNLVFLILVTLVTVFLGF
jgi:hypothetical protein